ncbi:energy-coupling factor transporter transmembrane component T [Paenibacillus turpanensis]|uniref:energy-coupling factor transporter transmembrane component T n=1 Tax=Paenibacillus turpanensis TaxID=2689078 RepID=UPI0014098744|nr:energy-coupling factor transporter transmembrane component T [Paenibacillus turpanensis]
MKIAVFSNMGESRLWLDPRTKIIMLASVNIVMIGGSISGADAFIRPALGLLPFLLLAAERKTMPAFLYLIIMSAALSMEAFLVSRTAGLLNLVAVIASGLLSRFIPVLVMGYYVVSTTKISELVAALERLGLPRQIIIPFSVMLRFFPTVAEEMAAIQDAMRMRGIRLGGQNTSAMLEYRIVPMLICCAKIGEELSAAALTRGLGKPVRRTNICRIGFSALDWALILISVGLLLTWLIY